MPSAKILQFRIDMGVLAKRLAEEQGMYGKELAGTSDQTSGRVDSSSETPRSVEEAGS